MATVRMHGDWELVLRKAVKPAMKTLAKDIADDYKEHIYFETGEAKRGVFSEVDEVSVATIGTVTHDGHAIYPEFGTETQEAQPELRTAANKQRGEYR